MLGFGGAKCFQRRLLPAKIDSADRRDGQYNQVVPSNAHSGLLIVCHFRGPKKWPRRQVPALTILIAKGGSVCDPVHSYGKKMAKAPNCGASQPALRDDEVDDIVHAFAQLEVGEDEGAGAAHAARVSVHDLEAGADQWGEIDLVDDEQIGAGDPGAAFARDLVAGGDVNDIDRQIGEFGREGRGEVVAPRLDQYQVETRKYSVHLGDGGEIDRGVLADRRVRTAPGLDAADPLRRQRSTAGQEFGVLASIDVVGDDRDLVAAPHLFAQPIHQRGFARADWAANPETQWTAHDRK